MRVIKYYDRIHKQMLELEVSDEVAKFLHADNRRLSRQGQRDKEYIALSLDAPTEYNGEEALTYGEIIPDPNAYIDKIYEQKEFSKCIWRIVDKLEKKQAIALKMYYKIGYRAKEVADYLGMTTSAFTQFKETALKHLHIQLSYDNQFRHTSYYEVHYKNFANDVINQVKESLDNNKISINLNNVLDLMKNVTQLNKITEKIGIQISDELTNQLQTITKPVWDFIKMLKHNGKYIPEQQNFLNIPLDNLNQLIK